MLRRRAFCLLERGRTLKSVPGDFAVMILANDAQTCLGIISRHPAQGPGECAEKPIALPDVHHCPTA